MSRDRVSKKLMEEYERYAKKVSADPCADCIVKANVLLSLIHEVKVSRFKSSTRFKKRYKGDEDGNKGNFGVYNP